MPLKIGIALGVLNKRCSEGRSCAFGITVKVSANSQLEPASVNFTRMLKMEKSARPFSHSLKKLLSFYEQQKFVPNGQCCSLPRTNSHFAQKSFGKLLNSF